MHSEGLALLILLQMQERRRDPAVRHRAELMAAHRVEQRSVGRLRRRPTGQASDS